MLEQAGRVKQAEHFRGTLKLCQVSSQEVVKVRAALRNLVPWGRLETSPLTSAS